MAMKGLVKVTITIDYMILEIHKFATTGSTSYCVGLIRAASVHCRYPWRLFLATSRRSLGSSPVLSDTKKEVRILKDSNNPRLSMLCISSGLHQFASQGANCPELAFEEAPKAPNQHVREDTIP